MENGKSKKEQNSNSFYRLGGIEILSIQQKEDSGLWKIYLSTTDHYLVSREFDRRIGLYGNAPDDIIRRGLMDFSDSLICKQFSLWKTMDLFIDRCFDDAIFDGYTENGIWMSIDHPSYLQVEDIIGTYNCRLKWFPDDSDMGEMLNAAMFKTLAGDDRRRLVEGIKQGFVENGISSVFLNHDIVSEKILSDREFENMPVFIGEFSDGGDFRKFNYMRR
jgi:hypothetical protein